MTPDSPQFAVRTVADDDMDLVHASENGDVAAFEQLVKRYDRKLLRIAHNVTHNTEDSQDAVQETFLKAFQHLGSAVGDKIIRKRKWSVNRERKKFSICSGIRDKL